MNKTQRQVLKQTLPLVLGVVASIASVMILIFSYKSFIGVDVLLGLFGALVGVVVAYVFARIKDATDPPKIYISYSHDDKEFVYKLYYELKKLPFEILWDQKDLKVGDDIQKKTEELMNNSDYFLFVSSINSSESNWASSEIDKAIKLKKKILPVVIDDSSPPEIINKILYADFSSSFENGMSQLAEALKSTRHNKSLNQTGANNAPSG